MKSFAITALLGSSTMATKLTSSCLNSKHNGLGVSCIPDNQLFATGMNGDEDLGEDIIMKGKPFHYNQMKVHDEPAGKPPTYEPVTDEAEKVHVLQTPNAGFRTTFYLGKDSKVQNMAQVGEKPAGYEPVTDEAEKVHVLQTPNAGYRTTFYAQQLAQAGEKPAGYEPVTDEAEKVHVLQTPNAGYRTTFYAQQLAQAGEKPAGYEPVTDEAEKVHVLQTPNAGYRTTFYAQQLAQAGEKPAGYEPVTDEAEKVHVLQTPNAGYRTTFYAQADPEAEQPPANSVAAGPEKVSVLDTPIAKTHTTFYNQQGLQQKGNAPAEAGPKKKKADPVSPEGMDPWVYQTSKENSGVFPNTHGVELYPPHGFMAKSAEKAAKMEPEFYFK